MESGCAILFRRKFLFIVFCFLLRAATVKAQAPPPVAKPEVIVRVHAYKEELKIKAEAGQPKAQYMLGMLYEFPMDGSVPNRKGAAYWYKQASDRGYVRGTFRLGLYYYDQGDDSQAYGYLEKAAKEDFVPAMTKIGEMILNGNMFGNGRYYSQPWFEKAAAAGDPDAQNDLGLEAWNSYLHPVVPGNAHPPVEWFRMSATGGSCEGMMNLGGVYFNGLGVAQSASLADAAFRQVEVCPGVASWVKSKASHFRSLIAAGRLPNASASEPDHYVNNPSLFPQEQKIDTHEAQAWLIIAGAAVLFGMAASGSNAGSGASSYDAAAAQAESNKDLGRIYCNQGSKWAANTLGYICY